MADLNVQPKKRTPVWPWLLLVLVIAAVVFFLMRDTDVSNDTNADDTITTDTTNQYRSDTIP